MQETENSILKDLTELGDILSRSELLIRLGRRFPGMDDADKNESNLIKDCQTNTWVEAWWEDSDGVRINRPEGEVSEKNGPEDDENCSGNGSEKNGSDSAECCVGIPPEAVLRMRADSQSLIVKGALALIDEIFNGRTRKEVKGYECRLMQEECFYALFSDRQRLGMKSIINKLSD